jgi:hypothetical protein
MPIHRISSLMILTFLVPAALSAGNHRGPKAGPRFLVTGEEVLPAASLRGSYPSTYHLGPGDSIGFTTYDFGTNGSAAKNLVNFGDGTLSLGRMASLVLDPANPDRGSFFSHSQDGGVTWPPLAKVETARRGWTSIDQLAEAGGVEVVVSHDFAVFGLEVNLDAARGLGIWSATMVGTSVWPRLAIGSGFSIHLVGSSGGNPPTLITYTRSVDGGSTFDIVDQVIFTSPGVVPDADGQDIAAQGQNVAIVSAGLGGDVGLLTSTDGGTTWTEQIIYDVSGAGELPQGEEEFQPDGSCAALFDNAGNLHVAWSNYLAVGDVNNNPELFYSVDAPIMVWNQLAGVQNAAFPVPDTSIGVPIGRDGNYASQPDIGVDQQDNIFVVYSSMVNDQDTAGNYYEHVFSTQSLDGGLTWSAGADITPGTGFEASFPSVADRVDANFPVDATLHVVYNCDPFAGTWQQTNHSQIQVAVMYLQVPVNLSSVADEGNLPAAPYLGQNYPNPFNPATTIEYSLARAGFATMKIFNILGQEVAELFSGQREAGRAFVRWDAAGQPSGVYFCRLEAGDVVQTRKLVLMR